MSNFGARQSRLTGGLDDADICIMFINGFELTERVLKYGHKTLSVEVLDKWAAEEIFKRKAKLPETVLERRYNLVNYLMRGQKMKKYIESGLPEFVIYPSRRMDRIGVTSVPNWIKMEIERLIRRGSHAAVGKAA